MRLTLNGQAIDTDAIVLGALLGDMPQGSAVAVDGRVVPRGDVATRPLAEGEEIEVVTAVAGG